MSSVISKHDDTFSVRSFVQLFDSSNQDWFSVASIVQNLLQAVKVENPDKIKTYLRSDGAGCYHSNVLILACNDISTSSGVQILGYEFSKPQNGKDICDRIICPMKSSIKTYFNEGHDILSAVDMHCALKELPVTGVTASVVVIDESKILWTSIKCKGSANITTFDSKRVRSGSEGLTVSARVKTVATKSRYKKHLVHPSLLNVPNTHGFFPCKSRTMDKKRETEERGVEEIGVFDCHEPGVTNRSTHCLIRNSI